MQFSVVVPLYNKAAYVRQTIESVLAQSLADFELLVVDDGSTDAGSSIVEALGDPRIRVIRQDNAGVSVARNRGIAEARGEWVCFLDADDWWHPEFLGRMAAVVTDYPDVEIVASAFKELENSDSWCPEPWVLPKDAAVELIVDLPTRWRSGPCFFTGTVMLRREFLLTLTPCFPVGEGLGEDLDLWFRAAERSAVAFLQLPLACYRTVVPGSLMDAPRRPMMLPSIARMRERAVGGKLPGWLARSNLRFVAEFHVSLAREELAAGRRMAALSHLGQGWRAISGRRWWFTIVMLVGIPLARR